MSGYSFVWHVIVLFWATGVGVGGVIGVVRYRRSDPVRQLEVQVREQVLQTRRAELQARERKALNV